MAARGTGYGTSTGLVVVDVQNDFADPGGGLYIAGGEDVVDPVNAEIEAAVSAGSVVVYTQDWHPPTTPHFVTEGGIWPVHCVRDTWGAELHPRLQVRGPVLRKGVDGEDGYSGFSVRDPVTGETGATALEKLLREKDVRQVVVVGLAGDVCVKATALDGLRLGFGVSVVWSAVRSVELAPGDGERARAELVAAGASVVGG